MVDISEMDMTADGSMVRVDMLDEEVQRDEPMGRFIGVKEAIMLEARGKCKIKRKKKDMAGAAPTNVTVDENGKVMVEYLEKALIRSYGRYGSYKWKDAVLGEKSGKWKIVKSGQPPQTNQIGAPIPCLTYEDVYGQNYQTQVRNLKKKRIAWIQDNFIVGGAELSNRLVIKIGLDCGYHIDLITPTNDPVILGFVLNESDMIILNNIWGFSKDHMRVIFESIFAVRKPYIKYEHDHRELGRIEFSRRIFQNSALNVFLSPAHLKNHQEALGCDGIALPLAIDTEFFKPVSDVQRKRGTAIVSNVRNFKLWTNLQKYINDHQDIKFTVMAKDPTVYGPNVEAKGMVAYEKMPELYSSFEYVVHILDGWGAGERVVFEGALCGCNVIANERVGHMSWGIDLNDADGLRDWLVRAPYQFWQEVEKRI